MREHSLLSEEPLITRAVQLLMREMGSIETTRFLTMAPNLRIESVKRHQQWQQNLEPEAFFDQVFNPTGL